MRRAVVLLLLLALPLYGEVQPDLVVTRPFTNRMLIPAAGSVQGAADAYFQSDVRLTNLGSAAQLVEMIWLPREGWATPPRLDPSAGIIVRRTLEVGETLHSDDFVVEVLGTDGLGAVVVRAIRENGETDPDGKLHATSRIWTRAGGGTMSQSFPGVAFSDIVSEHAVILGHRRDETYRTNVGIVNLDDTDAYTFVVTVTGENPTLVAEIYEVKVPPYGIALIPVQGVQQTKMRIDIDVQPLPGGGSLSLWQAFASTVDNRTTDAWSTLAFDLPSNSK